ncbi:50S ribosomal protein L21 [Candidatus Peregrinibacteria bacterium]|nr:50S ribosomal protein L21 [Candidatus Peregrinibacteria bacterium]
MFAVVEIAGKQYKITSNSKIQVDLLPEEPGKTYTINKVLLIGDEQDSKTEIGKPYLEKEIEAKVVEHMKGEKIRVYKKRAKKRYEKTIGHRQKYTVLEFGDIK